MPVSTALAENLASRVVALYAEAERILLERIARNVGADIDNPHWAEKKLAQIQEYERQTRALLADLQKRSESAVASAVTEAYDRGGLAAVADLAAKDRAQIGRYSAVEWQPTP